MGSHRPCLGMHGVTWGLAPGGSRNIEIHAFIDTLSVRLKRKIKCKQQDRNVSSRCAIKKRSLTLCRHAQGLFHESSEKPRNVRNFCA